MFKDNVYLGLRYLPLILEQCRPKNLRNTRDIVPLIIEAYVRFRISKKCLYNYVTLKTRHPINSTDIFIYTVPVCIFSFKVLTAVNFPSNAHRRDRLQLSVLERCPSYREFSYGKITDKLQGGTKTRCPY